MANVTFDSLKKEISNRNFAPVYLLMGEEAYFIDQLTELLLEKVLTEADVRAGSIRICQALNTMQY